MSESEAYQHVTPTRCEGSLGSRHNPKRRKNAAGSTNTHRDDYFGNTELGRKWRAATCHTVDVASERSLVNKWLFDVEHLEPLPYVSNYLDVETNYICGKQWSLVIRTVYLYFYFIFTVSSLSLKEKKMLYKRNSYIQTYQMPWRVSNLSHLAFLGRNWCWIVVVLVVKALQRQFPKEKKSSLRWSIEFSLCCAISSYHCKFIKNPYQE